MHCSSSVQRLFKVLMQDSEHSAWAAHDLVTKPPQQQIHVWAVQQLLLRIPHLITLRFYTNSIAFSRSFKKWVASLASWSALCTSIIYFSAVVCLWRMTRMDSNHGPIPETSPYNLLFSLYFFVVVVFFFQSFLKRMCS